MIEGPLCAGEYKAPEPISQAFLRPLYILCLNGQWPIAFHAVSSKCQNT